MFVIFFSCSQQRHCYCYLLSFNIRSCSVHQKQNAMQKTNFIVFASAQRHRYSYCIRMMYYVRATHRVVGSFSAERGTRCETWKCMPVSLAQDFYRIKCMPWHSLNHPYCTLWLPTDTLNIMNSIKLYLTPAITSAVYGQNANDSWATKVSHCDVRDTSPFVLLVIVWPKPYTRL